MIRDRSLPIQRIYASISFSFLQREKKGQWRERVRIPRKNLSQRRMEGVRSGAQGKDTLSSELGG